MIDSYHVDAEACMNCGDSLPHLHSPLTKQEPRHLQLLSDLEDSNIFTTITGRKLHNAPTDYQFCIKVTLLAEQLNESISEACLYECGSAFFLLF